MDADVPSEAVLVLDRARQARRLARALEQLPVGVLTAIIGVPSFLIILHGSSTKR